jgi:hypothetical protein
MRLLHNSGLTPGIGQELLISGSYSEIENLYKLAQTRITWVIPEQVLCLSHVAVIIDTLHLEYDISSWNEAVQHCNF